MITSVVDVTQLNHLLLHNGEVGLVYAEGSGSSSSSSGASSSGGVSRKRRDGVNGTPLRDVLIGVKHSPSQFSAAQKLAESKIGCGGDSL